MNLKKKATIKNKNMNFKCNINVKAMASGQHKKSCVLNLLFPVK